MIKKIIPLSYTLLFFATLVPGAQAQDARALVEAGFNYIRDKASVSIVEMTIHRPTWERMPGISNQIFCRPLHVPSSL